MDEKERQQDTFDLEEILKEFAETEEESPGLPEDEEILRVPEDEEDILIWNGVPPAASSTKTPSLGDTVPLGDVTRAVKKMEHSNLEQTVTFTPVGQEYEDEEPLPVYSQAPKVEPYSEEWEPEYEQPIGEYTPQEPIVFRPKSRLRELKRKLVAGPEKRYYELSELGLGKLQLAILCNLLVALLSAGTTVMHGLGMVPDDRIRFVIFIQFLSLLLSALLGSYQLTEGFGDILKKRFSLNSLLLFSLLACLTDGIIGLQQVRIPCCAAFSLNMTMSLWSAYQKRNTELGQMDTMRKATRLDSVVSCADYYEGRPGFLRGEGQVEDFMDHYNTVSGPEKVMSGYALAVLMASVVIGVTAGFIYGPFLGVQTFASALLVAVPASAYVTLSRPMAVLERRLHKLGAVICGWRGVKALSAPAVFPINDTDLFPSGTAKMNGVKFYGQRSPDQVVAYAAALIGACGGGMEPLFTQLLDSRNGHHYDAQGLRGYPGGIGAIVNEEAVLAGTQQFMQDMGVDMPAGTRVNQAVYVAIDGQLSGIFAISYTKTRAAAGGLTTLCGYRRLKTVMVGGDFMLTESFLRNKFGVSTRQVIFPNRETRQTLQQKMPEEGSPALALTTREGLAGCAYAVTGARAVRTASIAGVAIHMLGGISGLVIMLILALVGASFLLTPMNVLLYGLIWMVPGLLITEWTRAI